MKKVDFRKYYPVGFEYKKELRWVMFFWGLELAGSLYFFIELSREVQSLYHYVNGERFLRQDRIAASFLELADWYWAGWVPMLIFLFVMPLYHYFFYYRDTKSIYVMRRLPRRGVTFKSCVQGPLLSAAAVLASAFLLYLLYFGIYMLSIPAHMGRLV